MLELQSTEDRRARLQQVGAHPPAMLTRSSARTEVMSTTGADASTGVSSALSEAVGIRKR